MASLPPLKPLLKTFRQPTWLAVFISAGMHGALFAASPSFSSSALTSWSNPGRLNRPHTVPLIELTSEERNRLPNFSDQSLSLFPEFNQEELFNFPTPSPPDIADPLSSAGLPQDWLTPSPFQRQPTQLLPPPSSIPLDPFTGALPPFPFPNQTPNPLTTGNSDVPSNLEELSEETATQSVDQAGEENAEQSTGAIANNPSLSSTGTTGLSKVSLDELERVEDLESWQIARGIRIPGSLNLEPGEPVNGAESEPSNQETQLSFNPPVIESIKKRLDAYTYHSEMTSEAVASEALTAWTAEVQTQSGIEDLQPDLVELSPIENPVRICLPQAPTAAMIGVLINPEGQIVDPPRLLKSTGYGALNNWAAQSLGQSLVAKEPSLENQNLENQDLFQIGYYQAFSFEIPINYDAENCVDRTRLIQSNGE